MSQASIWSVAPLGKTTILAASRRRMAKRQAEERLDTWPTDIHTVQVGSSGPRCDFLGVAFNKSTLGINIGCLTPKKQNDNLNKKTWQLEKKTLTHQLTWTLCVCVSLWGVLFFLLLLDSLDPKKKVWCTYILPGGPNGCFLTLISTCVCPLSFKRSPPKMYGMVSWTVSWPSGWDVNFASLKGSLNINDDGKIGGEGEVCS